MAKRIYYTARWRALRQAKLDEQPNCEVCQRRGAIVVATVVDHKRSIASGGDPFPPLAELASMCSSCHNAKTAALDNPHAFGGGSSVAFKGCGPDGLPIDHEHPFWRGSPPHKGQSKPRQPSGSLKKYLVPKNYDI